MIYLDKDLSQEAISYLKGKGLLTSKPFKVEIPGEGNMNVVLRLITDDKSIILKQSRPFVRKYPQVAAPEDRIITEAAYFTLIKVSEKLMKYSPEILFFDPNNNLLVLKDFGTNQDCSNIYSNPEILNHENINDLVSYLNELHVIKTPTEHGNKDLLILNHKHIFEFPFQETGFNLDDIQVGLENIKQGTIKDKSLIEKIRLLGEKYLEKDHSVIHGDYYPGSFLKTETGIKVIDPEFSFLGPREFDLGVLKAHLILANSKFQNSFLTNYESKYDLDLVNSFTGIEILRRLLGLAQLPISRSLVDKQDLINFAKNLILS